MSGRIASAKPRALIGLLAALGLVAALTMPALASSVTPTPISDDNNPTCASLGYNHEVKFDPPKNDTKDNITVSNFVQSTSTTPGSFDWSSTFGIDAVLVKAGDDKHNVYTYSPEATSDTGLQPQAGSGNGISHISFCWDDVTATPTPVPSSTATSTPTDTPTPTATPTPTPEGSVEAGTPTPTPTASPSERGEVEAGNPTPKPSAGELPDTAMGEWSQIPAAVLSLVLVAALVGLVALRLSRQR